MERHTWEWTRLQIHVMETLPFLFKVGWLGSFTLYIFTAKEFTVVPVMIQMCTWIDSYLGEIWKQFLFLFLATIRIYWCHPVDECGMGPEGIRQCMSLGYSRKNTNTTIGQCKWVSFSFVSYISWRTNDARICTQKILIKCTQKILIQCTQKILIKCIQENTDLLYSEK
jgi:hypothetical protein